MNGESDLNTVFVYHVASCLTAVIRSSANGEKAELSILRPPSVFISCISHPIVVENPSENSKNGNFVFYFGLAINVHTINIPERLFFRVATYGTFLFDRF